MRSFVEFAAADFEYCSWSASMTKLYCSLIKVQLEYCHNCRFQSWCHLDHGRTTDQRRFHFPLLSSSHTLSSFAVVYSPLLPYFHTSNNAHSHNKYIGTYAFKVEIIYTNRGRERCTWNEIWLSFGLMCTFLVILSGSSDWRRCIPMP